MTKIPIGASDADTTKVFALWTTNYEDGDNVGDAVSERAETEDVGEPVVLSGISFQVLDSDWSTLRS